MKQLAAVLFTAVLMSTSAFADEKPSDEQAGKIKEAIAAWGCEGGTFEKESEATGVFEIDDAKCKDGKQYDIKLDSNYTLILMSRD